MSKSKLSTHVLDTASGKPASGLFVELCKQKDEKWIQWHNTVTSNDGRINFPFNEDTMAPAVYKLRFNTEDYFKSNGLETFYPYAEIVFKVREGQHYHVPLLLSPYGYSTYRGS